jgi:hypothetical protein
LKKLPHTNPQFTAFGTNRSERILQPLLPENIRIDARALHDWLAFLARASGLLRYYNTQNLPAGTWEPFFKKDPTVVLALILERRPEDFDNELRSTVRRFHGAGTEKKQIQLYEQLLDIVARMVQVINDWYLLADGIEHLRHQNPVFQTLDTIIRTNLAPELARFRLFVGMLQRKRYIRQQVFREQDMSLHAAWQMPEMTETDAPENQDKKEWLATGESMVLQLYHQLYLTMVYLHQKAGLWFRESLETDNRHEPHIALLLGYLQLFRHAQDQINDLPRKHLLYYFEEMLGQKPRPGVPERTIVCLQMAEHARPFRLPADTMFSAGVNAAGQVSLYRSLSALPVCNTSVAALKTVFISKNSQNNQRSSYKLVTGIYAAPIANSADGQGAPFAADDPTWPAFGEEQLEKNSSERRMIEATIGFMLASPVLFLSEGRREIYLQLRFSEISLGILMDLIDDMALNTGKGRSETARKVFDNAFLIAATSDSGWMPLLHWNISEPEKWLQEGGIGIQILLGNDDLPICAHDTAIHGYHHAGRWPMLRILLNPDADTYLYTFCGSLEVLSVGIDVKVTGLKSLTLYNQIGLLDANSPFQPFGPLPQRNAYLLAGSAELFSKRLTDVQFHIRWNNLPDHPEGFAGHYSAYPGNIRNDSFKVRVSALSNYTFQPANREEQPECTLFEAPDPEGPLAETTLLSNLSLAKMQVQPDYTMTHLPEYTNRVRAGYFRLQLDQPAMGFGHNDYYRLFSQAMIAQSQSNWLSSLKGAGNRKAPELPAEPFVPVIHQIQAGYSARTIFNLNPLEFEENDVAADEKIYTLHPFGYHEIFARGRAVSRRVFPEFQEDAYLYIGLNGAEAGQELTLFFHIRESKLHWVQGAVTLEWAYLRQNHWEQLTHEHLLANGTRDFTTSGIVSLRIPQDPDNRNTILPPDIFWIRIAAKGNIALTGRVQAVGTNAVELEWTDNGDPTHWHPTTVLPPVQELRQRRADIAGLQQVLPFYGGQAAEKLPDFLVRTSERLRHKNRAITIWDIERLTLEQFPFLRRVKCVTCMEYPALQPGAIKVVAIPKARPDDREPMLGFHQLVLIQEFLEKKVSPFVSVEVINPMYDRLRISCSLLLTPEADTEKGRYLQVLHEELLHFLCPWLADNSEQGIFQLGGSISKNDVLSFILERPYVSFVTRFSIAQIVEDKDRQFNLADTARDYEGLHLLQAGTPWSVFSPVAQHQITFINRDTYIPPEPAAIQGMRLGTDFIILDDNSPTPPMPDTETAAPAEPEDEWYIQPFE